jgi:hypothetical protein
MSIRVRRLQLQEDREVLVQFLFQHLSAHSDERRFDWLYLANPSGKAQVWAAEDSQTGAMVGASAVFPRLLYENGRERMGFVLGDFCIHPRYRSLGPAVLLQRTSIEEMSSAKHMIGYDLPSANMMAVQRRLGMTSRDRLARLAKPLRTDRRVAARIKMRSVAKGVSMIGNRVLKLRDLLQHPAEREEITQQSGPCQEEFNALAAGVSGSYGVCVARTASYLNWRYFGHPSARFEMLTARRDGLLKGYLVMHQEGEHARIVDLFGIPDLTLLAGLILKAVELMRDQGAMTLSAPLLASHPWIPLFERLGFRERDSCPVIFYPRAQGPQTEAADSETRWFLMDGDRDS